MNEPSQSARAAFQGYSQLPFPMPAYAGLVALYNLAFALVLLVSRTRRQPLPDRVGIGDLLLFGAATHKLSRLLASDWVTSVIRAPFSEFQGPSGLPGEQHDKPRGRGWQLALGQLLTCPTCLGQWIAAFYAYGLVFAIRPTRLVGFIFSLITIADFLNVAYESAHALSSLADRKANALDGDGSDEAQTEDSTETS